MNLPPFVETVGEASHSSSNLALTWINRNVDLYGTRLTPILVSFLGIQPTHEISPFVKLLLEAAVEGVLGGFADPARPLCQDNRWLGSEATGRLARWLKSRTAAIASRR